MKTLIVILALLIAGCASNPPDNATTPVITGGYTNAEYNEIIRQINLATAIGMKPENGLKAVPMNKIRIQIVPNNLSCAEPAFLAQGSNYNGEEICVAGQFIDPYTIKVARGAIWQDVVRYEMEHLLLYHFNPPRYFETLSHEDGRYPHPILGEL